MTRQDKLDELVARYGDHKAAAAVIRDFRHAFPAGSRALKEIEVFSRTWDDVGFGPPLERAEGRREVFRHVRLILSIDPDEVEQIGAVQAPGGED